MLPLFRSDYDLKLMLHLLKLGYYLWFHVNISTGGHPILKVKVLKFPLFRNVYLGMCLRAKKSIFPDHPFHEKNLVIFCFLKLWSLSDCHATGPTQNLGFIDYWSHWRLEIGKMHSFYIRLYSQGTLPSAEGTLSYQTIIALIIW